MATITSAGTGNSDATATWVGGVVPDADDDVVIDSGHTVTQNANATFNSLAVNGTFVASSSYSLTIDGERSNGRALDIVGTFTHGNGTITITTAADTDLRWPSSSEAYNITINNASCIARPTGDKPVIANNLTITTGEYNTLDSGGSTSHALTVRGRTDIGPASGSADQATLTCNASTVSLGSGRTSSYGLIVNQGGTFVGGSGNHTIGSIETKNNSNAKCTLTSGVTTIDSENTSDNFALSIEAASTFDDGNGTVTFTIGDSTRIRTNTKPLYNVIVNNANASIEYVGDQTIDNDLTVTAGKFRYNSFEDLTVTGDVSVTGILGHPNVATTSDSTFGSLTINSGGEYKAPSGTTTITSMTSTGSGDRSLNNKSGGTFTNNDGTVLFNSSSDQRMEMAGTGNVHNLTINKSDNDLVTFGNLTIEGDLSITTDTTHTMRPNNASETLTVTGSVTIVEGKLGDVTNYTGAISFGGLEIQSGGEYIATSGTTTITNKISSGTYTNYMFQNAGTFTHNNGTVHWKADTSSGTWFAMNGSLPLTNTEFYNISTERVRASGTEQYRFWTGGSGRFLTVLNNIDIGANTRLFSSNGSGNFRNDGICDISGILNIVNVTTVNMGAVTIESGGALEFADGNTVNVEGIRNLGGTVTVT